MKGLGYRVCVRFVLLGEEIDFARSSEDVDACCAVGVGVLQECAAEQGPDLGRRSSRAGLASQECDLQTGASSGVHSAQGRGSRRSSTIVVTEFAAAFLYITETLR